MSELTDMKARIRSEIREQRAALLPEWIATRSQQIAQRFMALDVFQAAETVCLYAAIAGEVRLDAVMEQCWEDGRRVLVPAFRKAQRSYGFKRLARDTKLVRGPWDVPEPAVDAWAEVGPAASIAVPGVAFDDAGGRVGHGGGYYDRLLAPVKGIGAHAAIGVCFDFQRIESVPLDAWDIGMDMVVSESRVTSCGGRAEAFGASGKCE